MKKYEIIFSKNFSKDIEKLKRISEKAYNKVYSFFEELEQHPRTGTGKPEQLKHNRRGQWSRRITKEHRLVYIIKDDLVEVLLISAVGHYKD